MVLAEISRQPSIASVAWLLVVITFMQIYNEKDQAEPGKIENVQLEVKRSIRKHNIGVKWQG